MRFTETKIYRGRQKDYKFPKPLQITTMGRGQKKYFIVDLFCGFDIETTTITTEDGRHLAFAYHFQFTIGTPRILNVYLFRTWEDWIDFLDKMAAHYQLGDKKRVLCGVANLSFEHAFMRKRLQWDSGEWDFFAKEIKQPLKATYKGIEFREVLSITGGSLAQLAKDYCYTQKLVGDLDYSVQRNSHYKMDPKTEEQYCINDVVIISEFMWWLFAEYIWPERYIPMTFTGILGRQIKTELKNLCRQRDDKYGLPHGSSYAMWCDYIKKLQPTKEEYIYYFKYLFRGGYVHGNALYTGLELLAHMRDITSHYPTRFALSYVPCTPFVEVDLTQFKTYRGMMEYLENVVKHECVIIHAIFDNIRPTTTHTIESKNKIIYYEDAEFDNGRLIQCNGELEVMLDEMSWKTYNMFYKWSSVTIKSIKTAKRGKYPNYILNVMFGHYKKKEQLKRAGKDKTIDYVIAKSRLNSTYGYTVKRLHLRQVLYDNELEWHEAEKELDYDKEISKAITSPFYGIWCTAAARYELTSLLFKLTKAGVECYYCDTDSIKYRPCHKAEQIFKHYNASIARHRKKRGLRSDLFNGLGEFDKEGFRKHEDGTKEWVVVKFKMLGSKRYIYTIDDKTYATVAGMPKASVDQLGKSTEEIFAAFNVYGYHLTPEQSDKLTAAYTDDEYSAVIDGELMTELSGVALYEIPFTLNIKDEYRNHIKRLQQQHDRLMEVL